MQTVLFLRKFLVFTSVICLLTVSSNLALAKQYSQLTSDTSTYNLEDFFIQTFGKGFENSLTKLTIKVTDVAGTLYPNNFVLKEWGDAEYSADNYAASITPCSFKTEPKCSGVDCDGSAWAPDTSYEIELDYSCRVHTFNSESYYALGMHGGNFNNNFRLLGSGTDKYTEGEVKTGITNFTADCYYGSGSVWGAWKYNQISRQTSYCYTDENVSDIYFKFERPDSTPPVVSAVSNPSTPDGNGGWFSTTPSITLNSTDTDLDYIEYSWDNTDGSWNLYDTTITSIDGEHSLFYRAADITGNISDIFSLNLKVDTQIPNVSYKIDPANPDGKNDYYVSTPKVILSSTSSDISVLQYSWDNLTWTDYATDVEIQDGDKTMYYRSEDNAGNFSDLGDFDVKVDTTAPEAVDNFNSTFDENNRHIKLDWDAEDVYSNTVVLRRSTDKDFDVSEKILDRSAEHTSYTDKSVKEDKKYYYKIRLVDKAGNESESKTTSTSVPEYKSVENAVVIETTPNVSPVHKEPENKPEVKGIMDFKAVPLSEITSDYFPIKKSVDWKILSFSILFSFIITAIVYKLRDRNT